MRSTPITPDLLLGALDTEVTERGLIPHRLPAWTRSRFPDDRIAGAEVQPAGVRLAFRTDATVVELDALPTRQEFVGLPPRPPGMFDVTIGGELVHSVTSTGGNVLSVDMATGSVDRTDGPVVPVRFEMAPGTKDVEIWLPHNQHVELIALRSDSSILPASTSGWPPRPRWVHYGSSISQGSNATSPSTTWVGLSSSAMGFSVTNLAFSGSAMLDPFVARVMRDEPAEVISLEVGINLVNGDVMRTRAFTPAVHGFLDTIRDGHPSTPIVVVSPFYCPIHENTPGPGAFDPQALAEGTVRFVATGDPGPGKLTLTVVRDELRRVCGQREDPNLYLVDGLDLYGPSDFDEFPLPDGLHPDARAHRRIAERFVASVPAVARKYV
ncbi:lipase [Rhodococcus sp. 14-2470-1b]|uniref:SGNH/GDSL hydrolase family protein n=1 Tax=Rhodococcus sp. 14-2470-1b TaxID=2023149 RepID=UPI000B9C22A9|nr:SGNH/GDSL hydrolase family protein [Rhodococcus sp. 14-2470-1b]OZF54767.1 lipase [Rhodococcus sp. 14-2470-1b]